MAKINSSGFVKSESIIVYPCAYRDSTIDLKSKLNLEENIIRTALYGNTGNRTYIVSKTDTKLVCFIKGYYFEITVEDNEFDGYSGIVINTTITNDDYKATVLTPFGGSTTDTVDQKDTDGTTYYFKALKFIKPTANETLDLYLDESKNTKPVSYADVGSIKLASAITGNLISGTGTGSIVQIKDDTVTNTASAENAIALGEGTTAANKNELAIGQYNTDTGTDRLFIIGNGTSESKKSDAFVVTKTNISLELPVKALNVTGAATFNSTLNVTGAATFNSTLNVTGAATFNSTLNVTGAATFNSTLDVTGAATFNSTLTCTNQIKGLSFYATSDERLKENIVDYVPENSILDLPIKQFDYKSDGSHHIGCIAQDLQMICPELVQEGEDGYLSIEENKLVYLLLHEVKKLKKRVDELECK